jgi:hypothetical protein
MLIQFWGDGIMLDVSFITDVSQILSPSSGRSNYLTTMKMETAGSPKRRQYSPYLQVKSPQNRINISSEQ